MSWTIIIKATSTEDILDYRRQDKKLRPTFGANIQDGEHKLSIKWVNKQDRLS